MGVLKQDTKFARLLYKHRISIRGLAEHAQFMGYDINKNTAFAVVTHSRDFKASTADKLVEVLNDMTGEEYTFNDIHDPFIFR